MSRFYASGSASPIAGWRCQSAYLTVYSGFVWMNAAQGSAIDDPFMHRVAVAGGLQLVAIKPAFLAVTLQRADRRLLAVLEAGNTSSASPTGQIVLQTD